MPAVTFLAPLSIRLLHASPHAAGDELHLLHLRSLLAEVPPSGRDAVEAVEEVLLDFTERAPTDEELVDLTIALDILRMWLCGYEAAKAEFEKKPFGCSG